MSAVTERRVLVEGWAFSPTAQARATAAGVPFETVGYWDPDRLAANDAVFHRPTAGAVAHLRDRYGVRWLLVDLSQPGVAPAIGDHAVLRYRSRFCAVYQLP